MNEYTEIEQFDTSLLLEDAILGEDNEVIGHFTSEDAEEFFSDPEQKAIAMASELTYLMDKVEASGFVGSSEGTTNPDLLRIEELANTLSWFAPEHLDSRFF